MNKKERKELLERIADEFGFTSECHYEDKNHWGYIDVDTIEWIRIGIKNDFATVGLRPFYYNEAGWERELNQYIKSLLHSIKERKINKMKNKKKEIMNCGAAYEC